MEKVKKPAKKKRSAKRILIDGGTDLTLRLLSLVIAITIWFVLSITQYPTINKTVTGVHVDFSLNGTLAEERGLQAINYKDITVDVEIKGMNYEIGNYTDNDLSATVNLDQVTKQGTYDLEIEVRSTHTADRVSIVSVTPDTIEVDFDRYTSKTLTLTAEAPLISAEEGYSLRQNSIEPSEVVVTGPETELDNISRAAVKISKSKKLSQDEVITADSLVFYDADDNKIDDSNLTISESSFDVSFVLYKKKTLDLEVDISNAPDDFDTASLPLKMTADQVSVITPDLDDNDTEALVIGTIPLSSLGLNSSFDFHVAASPGEINLDGIESVTVSLDTEGYTSKTFTVSGDRIQLENGPAGFKSTAGTQKLSSVIFCGPEEELEKMTDEDIYALVDLSDVSSAGSYTKEALVYAEGFTKCWCYGVQTVQVDVALPAAATDSEEE